MEPPGARVRPARPALSRACRHCLLTDVLGHGRQEKGISPAVYQYVGGCPPRSPYPVPHTSVPVNEVQRMKASLVTHSEAGRAGAGRAGQGSAGQGSCTLTGILRPSPFFAAQSRAQKSQTLRILSNSAPQTKRIHLSLKSLQSSLERLCFLPENVSREIFFTLGDDIKKCFQVLLSIASRLLWVSRLYYDGLP